MIDTLDSFLDEVGQSQYGWRDSLVWTYDKTRELIADGIKGDLVECGVAAGVHGAMFDRACQDAGETRNIRLFDSFEGLPHGDRDKDVEWSKHWGDGSGRLEPTGVAACSLADVQANLARWGCELERFSFFVGWFETVLPAVSGAWRARYEAGEAEGIALLRIDGDLYSSTLACLAYLEPLVVPGGVLVVDDFNLDGCERAVREYFTGTGRANQFWGKITNSGDYWTVKA